MINRICFQLKAVAFNVGQLRSLHAVIRKQNNNCRCIALAIQSGENWRNNNRKCRYVSTIHTNEPNFSSGDGVVAKLLSKAGIINLDKIRAEFVARLLYDSMIEHVDVIDFFEKYDLPDTFYSWFVLMELHLWMLSARAMADGEVGRHVRNRLFANLWQDVNTRIKKLGNSNQALNKTHISELSEQLQAALIAYDEGLQDNDMVLAGALWRRLYQQQDVQPKLIEQLVRYVRIQMKALDDIPSEKLFDKYKVGWKPMKVL